MEEMRGSIYNEMKWNVSTEKIQWNVNLWIKIFIQKKRFPPFYSSSFFTFFKKKIHVPFLILWNSFFCSISVNTNVKCIYSSFHNMHIV